MAALKIGAPLYSIAPLFHEMHDEKLIADSTTYDLALRRVEAEVRSTKPLETLSCFSLYFSSLNPFRLLKISPQPRLALSFSAVTNMICYLFSEQACISCILKSSL